MIQALFVRVNPQGSVQIGGRKIFTQFRRGGADNTGKQIMYTILHINIFIQSK